MSLLEQKAFYDTESGQYSRKRYEGELTTYTQFVFRRRRDIFIDYMNLILKNRKPVSVFEIGCADGVLLRTLEKKYGNLITKMVGVDVSSGMVDEARRQTRAQHISFALRGGEAEEKYDVVAELGVHVENLSSEIEYVKSHLKSGGYFVFSSATRDSLHTKIKMKEATYAQEYPTYEETETELKKTFEIVASKPYGLFVPKLWAIPTLGRILQPIFEGLLKHIAPSLFHEKVYLLKSKN